MLEEEREKAKTIRERMNGVVGGVQYGAGGSGGDSRYDSYNSKNYGGSKDGSNKTYGDGGMGMYGDYNYNKSTLDKYKNNDKQSSNKSTNITGPSIIPDITGGSITANPQDTRKPF